MERQRVSSSNLASVGYDPISQTLEIEFNHGGIYQYSGFPISEHQGLMAASSHGSYFVQNIKDVYFCQKIR